MDRDRTDRGDGVGPGTDRGQGNGQDAGGRTDRGAYGESLAALDEQEDRFGGRGEGCAIVTDWSPVPGSGPLPVPNVTPGNR
jgi:hypothetical protein